MLMHRWHTCRRAYGCRLLHLPHNRTKPELPNKTEPTPVIRSSETDNAAGAKFYPQFESSDFFANELDVVVFAVSILSFEEVLKDIPAKFLEGKLVVDVLSVKMHPKQTLLENLPADTDIL